MPKNAAPANGPRTFARQFGGPSDDPAPAVVATEKPKKEKQPKVKADPKLVAAARELRDRWLEHVNSGATLIESAAKYDVTRALPALSAVEGPDPITLSPRHAFSPSTPLRAGRRRDHCNSIGTTQPVSRR